MKRSLSWPRKLESRKISSACWLSLMYDVNVLTIGAIILSKKFGGTTAGRDDGSNDCGF